MTQSGAALALAMRCGADVAHVRCSTRVDGNFHRDEDPVALQHRQQAFTPGPWTHLDEVHGTVVREVTHAGEFDDAEGDAAVTRVRGAVLSVWVGDCAPIVFAGEDARGLGVVGVAHAGWRGALDGVLPATVAAMRAARSSAVLGPCIGPCCYEFGVDLLARFVDRFGPGVAARTTWGAPSLSMPAVVRASLAESEVEVCSLGGCTRCDERWFSHRRGEEGRHVMTVHMMAAG